MSNSDNLNFEDKQKILLQELSFFRRKRNIALFQLNEAKSKRKEIVQEYKKALEDENKARKDAEYFKQIFIDEVQSNKDLLTDEYKNLLSQDEDTDES